MTEDNNDKTACNLSFVIEPSGNSEQLSGRTPRLVEFTEEALKRAKETIVELGQNFAEALDRIPATVDYVDLKFGLKFDAQAGVVVSKIGTQASLDVTLRIKPSTKVS